MTAVQSSSSSVTTTSWPLLAGYSHVRLISKSTFHETLMAQEEDTKDIVLIRVYALEVLRTNAYIRDRVERWVLVGRATQHSNIVRILSSFISETDLFVVEEYCEGGELLVTLDDYYKSLASAPSMQTVSNLSSTQGISRIGLHFVQCVMLDIMKGLHHLHTICCVAHRNVKLESVFLVQGKRAKLGRLGSCAVFASTESGGEKLQLCCASKHYAAPELVRGECYEGELIDVWAAGVVLFVMLTGRFPFEETEGNTGYLFERICAADEVLHAHPALSLVSDPLAVDLVRNMLRTNPRCRLTAEEVLQHPFLLSISSE